MTIKQIMNEATWVELTTIKDRYPNFINYVVLRYGDFESRYPELKFRDLFISLVINNQTELAMGETIVANTQSKLEGDKLGTVSFSTTANVSVRENENTASYSGYNASGDFAKNKNAGNTKHDATIKSTNINYFEYLATMNNSRFKDTWKSLDRQIKLLCITIKNLE